MMTSMLALYVTTFQLFREKKKVAIEVGDRRLLDWLQVFQH